MGMSGKRNEVQGSDYFETSPNNIPVTIFMVVFSMLIYSLKQPRLRDTALRLVDVIFSN